MKVKSTIHVPKMMQKYQEMEKKRARESAKWVKRIKMLSPKEGDILVIPAEANIDFMSLSVALKDTKVKYALIAPEGNVNLMDKNEAKRFAERVLKENGQTTTGTN